MFDTIRTFMEEGGQTPTSSKRLLWLPKPKYVSTSSRDVQTEVHAYLTWYADTMGRPLKCMYLCPKRLSLRHVQYPHSPGIQYDSLQHFVRFHVLQKPSSSLSEYDLIVWDDFEIESLEKYILMMAFVKGFLRSQKMIVVASYHDVSDHMNMINAYIGCPYDMDACVDVAPQMISSSSYVHEQGSSMIDIEYCDVFSNYDGEPMWEFDPATFITPTDMCNIVQSILTEHVPSSHRRTLIFVQSADVGEYIRDTIHLYSSLSAITIHGQKSHQEMDQLLSNPSDVILATNILESGDRMIPNVHMIIDFGLCYAINTYGFLSLRYSSKMEMTQRAKYICSDPSDPIATDQPNKRLIRIMSQDFFETLPYMELSTFEWKHFMMEQILHNTISTFLQILHEHSNSSLVPHNRQQYESPIQKDVYRDVLDLMSYHLITYECTLTTNATRYAPIFHHLLRTPFHTKQYAIIAHFHHMCSIDAVPLILQIYVSLTIAVIDTIQRYGQFKLFYLPLRFNRSPNQMFNAWIRVLYKMSGFPDPDRQPFIFHDHNFLSIFLQLVLTIVMSRHPYKTMHEFHLNTRVFRQILYRWKILCGREILNVFGYTFPITDRSFMHYVKKAVEPHVESRTWSVRPRDHFHYLLDTFVSSGAKRATPSHQTKNGYIQGTWCALPTVITDAYVDRMWRLLDYSTWTQSIRPYDRRLYFDHDMDEPYITIDAEHSVYLPVPKPLENFVTNLRTSIEHAVMGYRTRTAERAKYQKQFDECIHDIDEEVAYRPGMFKYMECEHRFYDHLQSWMTNAT